MIPPLLLPLFSLNTYVLLIYIFIIHYKREKEREERERVCVCVFVCSFGKEIKREEREREICFYAGTGRRRESEKIRKKILKDR